MHEHIIQAIDNSPLNRGLSGAAWLASPGNTAITFDNGDIMLFDKEGEGEFEGHILFKSRGKQALIHVCASFQIMFEKYGAELLIGMVPADRRDVKLLLRWAGCKSAGIRQTVNGPCELFYLAKGMSEGMVQ